MALDEAAFVEQLRTDPSDGPRLIFADWLDEQGRAEQAEFIRIQCALAQLATYDPLREPLQQREQILREDHERSWAASLEPYVLGWEFRRGIIDSISITAKAFLDHAPTILQRAPIRRVRLLELGDALDTLTKSPWLSAIRELDLCGNDLADEELHHLVRSTHFGKIEALDLGFSTLTDVGFADLARCPALSELRSLSINDNPGLNAHGLKAIAEAEHLRGLEYLDLSGNLLPHSAFRVLWQPSNLPALRSVVWHTNRLGDQGLVELLETEFLERLLHHNPTLDLRSNELGPIAMRELARAKSFALVETLLLDRNSIGDDGLRMLADCWHNNRLSLLSLQENRITDDGCYGLARSPLMATLRMIDLSGNFVTQSCQQRLQEAAVEHDWRGLVEVRTDSELRVRPTLSWTPQRYILRARQ